MRRSTIAFAVTLAALGAWSDLVRAGDVQFDTPASTTAVADGEPGAEDYVDAVPARTRIVRIPLEISAFLRGEDDGLEFVYSVESPTDQFQVVDYSPKTALDTQYAGSIAHEESRDRKASLNADATGLYKHITGASATGSYDDTRSSRIRYELTPPMELVAASGTIQRGTGVYFKLKSSPRATLEGAKEFVIVARVPAAWRGEVLKVRCEARRTSRSFLDDEETVGRGEFLVAAYLDGDPIAWHAAGDFADAERRLRRAAVAHRRSIEKQAMPNLVYRAGFKAPKIPSNWLNQVLFAETRADLLNRLPSDVRTAATEFSEQRARMHGLNGTAMLR